MSTEQPPPSTPPKAAMPSPTKLKLSAPSFNPNATTFTPKSSPAFKLSTGATPFKMSFTTPAFLPSPAPSPVPNLTYSLEHMLQLQFKARCAAPHDSLERHDESWLFLQPSRRLDRPRRRYGIHELLQLKAKHFLLPEKFPDDFDEILVNHYASSLADHHHAGLDGDVRAHNRSKSQGRKPPGHARSPVKSKKTSKKKRKSSLDRESRRPATDRRSNRSRHGSGVGGNRSARKGFGTRLDFDEDDLKELHKSDNKWTATKADDEDEVGKAQQAMRVILNKLAGDNFDKLVAQTLALDITSFTTMEAIATLVFHKAIEEPNFAALYAAFIQQLQERLPSYGEEEGSTRDFRWVLLKSCHTFLVTEQDESAWEHLPASGQLEQSLKAWDRRKGNIILLGELFKKGLLARAFLHHCVDNLLEVDDADGLPAENDVEFVCLLLKGVGEELDAQADDETGPTHMDTYFARMIKLSLDQLLPSRLRYMLKGLIETRQRGWLERGQMPPPRAVQRGRTMPPRLDTRQDARQGPRPAVRTPLQLTRSTSRGTARSDKSAKHDSGSMSVGHTPAASPTKESLSSPPGTPGKYTPKWRQRAADKGPASASTPVKASLVEFPAPSVVKRCVSSPIPATSSSSACSPPRPAFDREKVKRRIELLIKEFYGCSDTEEACLCLQEVHDLVTGGHSASTHEPPAAMESLLEVNVEAVARAVLLMLEMTDRTCTLCCNLLAAFCSKGLVNSKQLSLGLGQVWGLLADVSLDAPLAKGFFVRVVTSLLDADLLALDQVCGLLSQSCEGGHAVPPLEALTRSLQAMKDKERCRALVTRALDGEGGAMLELLQAGKAGLDATTQQLRAALAEKGLL